jgi:hypothetical protein
MIDFKSTETRFRTLKINAKVEEKEERIQEVPGQTFSLTLKAEFYLTPKQVSRI